MQVSSSACVWRSMLELRPVPLLCFPDMSPLEPPILNITKLPPNFSRAFVVSEEFDSDQSE